MSRACVIWLAGLHAAVFAMGCASTAPTVRENEDVLSQLENEGLILMRTGVSNFDVFSVPGERFQVAAGGTLHLHEYGDENRAALDASRLNPGIMSNAHVFRLNDVVAVYVGANLGVRSAISSVFGTEIY